jgi:protein-tyrosine-phosphatase
MPKKEKIEFEVMFVCTGNSCRSPMAEGILRKMLEDHGVSEIKVTSAGTCTLENMLPSPFAIQASQQNEVDISRQRSRQLTRRILEEANLILTMAQEHIDFIKRVNEKSASKAFLLKLFPQSRPLSNEERNRGVLFIKDPIGGSVEDYERSFMEIQKEVKRILPEILKFADTNKG